MDKPAQYEIDIAREVLEYCIADTTQNEPYAVVTLQAFENALANIPNEEDMEDL